VWQYTAIDVASAYTWATLQVTRRNPSAQWTSALTRTDRGISFTLQTSGLEAGHAVTVWWMVVNPDGGLAVLYAAGHVIGQNGASSFAGSLPVGDSDGSVMGSDTTLEDALQATVYLVVRDHGPANPRTVNAQIHTFAACNPPTLPDQPLSCTDLQMSVHQPAEPTTPAP
jgi:hypothetical protein